MSEEITKAENTNITSTLKPQNTSDAAKLANAMNASISLADLGEGAEIDVTDLIVTPGKRESREHPGEYLACENTYIISTEGVSYFSQSAGIARSSKVLGSMIDMLKGEKGYFTVRVISTPTQKGNVKTLMVVNALKK